MAKDMDKLRAAARERQRRYRERHAVTPDVTLIVTQGEDVPKPAHYPSINCSCPDCYRAYASFDVHTLNQVDCER